MLESFSAQAVQIIEDAKKIAGELNSDIVGSEHLLLSMYQTPDSICRFLLQEKNITYEDLLGSLDNITVIHKVTNKTLTFTDKFQEIILKSEEFAENNDSDYVFDEHIFYSLLDDNENIATEMLKMLNCDIEKLKNDVEEIFNMYTNEDEIDESPFPFLINLSKQAMVHPFVKRSNYIERINYILDKKQKNNPLLIGSAGVGKTAIVEGLSLMRTKETIYQLDLGGAVAGTKYRGELEEKILKVMNFIKEKQAILFIDEIHNIVGAGSNDGSLDIANILKPYLSRTDLSVIGATTLEEYYRFIEKDKALMRRFQTIFIDEPTKEETKKIILGIKETYEKFHNFTITNEEIDEIINQSSLYLPQKNFPDKAIDILDEIGARYSPSKQITDILQDVIYDQTNINVISLDKLRECNLNYNELKPYYLRLIKKIHSFNNIGVFIVEKEFNVNPLLTDLNKVFNFKKEMYLEINLDMYQDPVMINNLIGSAKGYVGYDEGGIVSEHIIKYPICLIYFKNFEKAHVSIKNALRKIMNSDALIDNKGRKIILQNVIFLYDEELKENKIGFIEQRNKTTKVIKLQTKKEATTNDECLSILAKYNINILNCYEVTVEQLKQLLNELIISGEGNYIIKDQKYQKQNQ